MRNKESKETEKKWATNLIQTKRIINSREIMCILLLNKQDIPTQENKEHAIIPEPFIFVNKLRSLFLFSSTSEKIIF